MALNILAAVYGSDNAGADVTERVRELTVTGNDDITISNGNLGGDPVPNVKKRLAVIYQLPTGQVLSRTGEEGTTIDLVPQM
ncbi:MAG: hypothetical protein AAF206_01535 [Bacteroidota bacterium]